MDQEIQDTLLRSIVFEVLYESLEFIKRSLTLTFTANAGALISIPTLLKELNIYLLFVPAVLFSYGVYMCLKGFWEFYDTLEALNKQLSSQIGREVGVATDKYREQQAISEEKNNKARKYSKCSMNLFIWGILLLISSIIADKTGLLAFVSSCVKGLCNASN